MKSDEDSQTSTTSELLSHIAIFFIVKGATMELIKISQAQIGYDSINAVNARDLHKVLESKRDFSTWIKKKLDDTQAMENEDFVCFHKKVEANNATMIEYIISLLFGSTLN